MACELILDDDSHLIISEENIVRAEGVNKNVPLTVEVYPGLKLNEVDDTLYFLPEVILCVNPATDNEYDYHLKLDPENCEVDCFSINNIPLGWNVSINEVIARHYQSLEDRSTWLQEQILRILQAKLQVEAVLSETLFDEVRLKLTFSQFGQYRYIWTFCGEVENLLAKPFLTQSSSNLD